MASSRDPGEGRATLSNGAFRGTLYGHVHPIPIYLTILLAAGDGS
jgi:hypothetical protein